MLKFKQAAAEEADPPGSFLPPYWRTTWKKTRLYKKIVRLDEMAKCRRILAESADCLSEWITAPKASSSSLEVSCCHVEKQKCASSEISESMEPSNVQKSAQIFWNPPRGGFIHQTVRIILQKALFPKVTIFARSAGSRWVPWTKRILGGTSCVGSGQKAWTQWKTLWGVHRDVDSVAVR